MIFMNYYSVMRDAHLFIPSRNIAFTLSYGRARERFPLFSLALSLFFAFLVYILLSPWVLLYFIQRTRKFFRPPHDRDIKPNIYVCIFESIRGRGTFRDYEYSRSGSYGMILDTRGSYICKARACAPRTCEVPARALVNLRARRILNARPRGAREAASSVRSRQSSRAVAICSPLWKTIEPSLCRRHLPFRSAH